MEDPSVERCGTLFGRQQAEPGQIGFLGVRSGVRQRNLRSCWNDIEAVCVEFLELVRDVLGYQRSGEFAGEKSRNGGNQEKVHCVNRTVGFGAIGSAHSSL